MAEPKRIVLDWPVTIHQRVHDERLSRLCAKVPLIQKILDRLPQGLHDKFFTDDYTVTERVFERGFCFIQIGRHLDRIHKILDVGCWSSDFLVEFASLGFEAWGLDQQEYDLFHPHANFVKGDICKAPFPENEFDCVTAISTVEHIGLAHYKDAADPDGDFKAMAEIHRILKPRGLLILTVPYGRFTITPVFRVYDKARLARLVQNFRILEEQYLINKNDQYWLKADVAQADQQCVNNRGRNEGNVCLVLEKI